MWCLSLQRSCLRVVSVSFSLFFDLATYSILLANGKASNILVLKTNLIDLRGNTIRDILPQETPNFGLIKHLYHVIKKVDTISLTNPAVY